MHHVRGAGSDPVSLPAPLPAPPLPSPPRRHRFFNTNNLWVNLRKLKVALEAGGGVLKLPLIRNKKTVNPREPSTPPVFQLETAMGSGGHG